MRHVIFLSVLLLLPARVAAASADGAGTDHPGEDILCANAPAGAVEPLPDLVRDWVVVLCTPTGQALAPQVTNDVILWLIHGTARNFMLEAAPPQFKLNNPQFPAYQIRFHRFGAVKATGERRRLSLELWKRGFDEATVPDDMGDIVQFEAQSVYNGTIFSLFFYLRNSTPRWLLVCRNRCDLSVLLDVLQGEELKARVAGQESPTAPAKRPWHRATPG